MKRQTIKITVALLFFVAGTLLLAQGKSKQQAFRNYEAASVPLVLPSTLDLQLLEAFVLMQKANAGESPAQHELGLRYLLGKGFPTDTTKAVFWIQKATDQNLSIANFNLGILMLNGQGVEWNPFKAYKHFRLAAERESPEAYYVMGLLNTENFVVPRNWQQAYKNFKKAVDLGFEPANISKKEMERRGLDKIGTTDIVTQGKKQPNNNTTEPAQSDTGFSLLFIDFHTDTTSTIEDTTLIKEAYEWKGTSLRKAKASDDDSLTAKLDSSVQSLLFKPATSGNPEALCLLGRCYERGLYVRRDPILACVYFLRALQLDSYRAPALIWKLMNTGEFSHELELRSSKNDPDAFYVWSGLASIGFSKLLNEKQAFDLLQRAVSAGHVPAMVELGSCYFTGRLVQQDREKAVELWNHASALGSLEAEIRLAAANVLGQIHTQETSKSFSTLRNTAKEGSLLSDLTLAYCYEKGIGLPQNKGEAYRIFHKSMFRGSKTAFEALRSMHDEIRPKDAEFQMAE